MEAGPELDRVVDQLTAEFHHLGRAKVQRAVLESWRLFDRVPLDARARATVTGWHARTRLCHIAN